MRPLPLHRRLAAHQFGLDTDPVEIIGLDCAPPREMPWRAMLRPELRAFAALAERHQKEFGRLLERATTAEAQAGEPG